MSLSDLITHLIITHIIIEDTNRKALRAVKGKEMSAKANLVESKQHQNKRYDSKSGSKKRNNKKIKRVLLASVRKQNYGNWNSENIGEKITQALEFALLNSSHALPFIGNICMKSLIQKPEILKALMVIKFQF